MLKHVFISLLAASLVLFAAIYLAYTPPAARTISTPLELNTQEIRTLKGVGAYRQGSYHLQLDESGQGIILVPTNDLRLDNYPYVHIVFHSTFFRDSMELLWKAKHRGGKISRSLIPSTTKNSVWLSMMDVAGWSGPVVSLAISVNGKPGEKLVLEGIVLMPFSFQNYLRSIYLGWLTFSPWTMHSINRHTGVLQLQTALYPVPLIAALFALSVLAYAVLVMLIRTNFRFDLRVPAMLFIVCWISLDLVWQGKLLHQLRETRLQFAGKDTATKLANGPDRNVYRFIEEVRLHLGSYESRIFVGSAEEYTAMRAAYYLYPYNVYWQRRGNEFPDRRYIRSGDYLVLMLPTELNFDIQQGTLFLTGQVPLRVKALLRQTQGYLFRVL